MASQTATKACPLCGKAAPVDSRRTTLTELTPDEKPPPVVVVFRCQCGVTFTETEEPGPQEAADPARLRASA